MAGRIVRVDGFALARNLRIAGHVTFVLWLAGWLVFAILVGTRARTDLVSAVAALICIMFAISFAFQVASRRVALRELTALIAREDLSASRSRGRMRVR
jgi:Mn2+/Fe2+ NRAMP family transporter